MTMVPGEQLTGHPDPLYYLEVFRQYTDSSSRTTENFNNVERAGNVSFLLPVSFGITKIIVDQINIKG